MHLPSTRAVGLFAAALAGLAHPAAALAQELVSDALLVTVPNPITSSALAQIKRAVEPRAGARGVGTIVFDFNPEGKPASTPEPGVCSDLAKLIGGIQGKTTVAFVHAPVTGHAVLPVLACKELVMGTKGVLGPVVVEGVPPLDPDVDVPAYRKRVGPNQWAIVQKMLDPSVQLVRGRARAGGGMAYADANKPDELKKLIDGAATAVPGLGDGPAAYTVALAHDVGGVDLAKGRADTLQQLEALYGLPRIIPNLIGGRTPAAFQLTLDKEVDGATRDAVNRVLRDVRKKKGNILILVLNCGGTNLDAARGLAEDLLAAQKGDEAIHVVGFVPDKAPDAATVVALGCTDIVMTRPKGDDAKEATIGDFTRYLQGAKPAALDAQKASLRQLAKDQGYPDLLIEGMLDPAVEIVRARGRNNRNRTQFMTREQLADAQDRKGDWVEDKVIKPKDQPFQLGAALAAEVGLARATVPGTSVTEVGELYGAPDVRNPEVGWVDKLAEFLRIPAVTIVLVMLGFIGLILELKVPGLTVPGITAALCFILVFWSQSNFSGETFVLALLLFVLGLVLVGLEIFVLPGFGACGIFGILCMLGGLGLVTMEKMPEGTAGWVGFGVRVSTYLFAMMGAMVFSFVIAKFLPQVPGANRLMLTPPTDHPHAGDSALPGASAAAELLGAIGTSTTPLRPAGVVRFGDQFVDVVSDGGFIPSGIRVQVIAVEGTRIVVKEV
jgi:membrane-bound ClpP family serine protease